MAEAERVRDLTERCAELEPAHCPMGVAARQLGTVGPALHHLEGARLIAGSWQGRQPTPPPVRQQDGTYGPVHVRDARRQGGCCLALPFGDLRYEGESLVGQTEGRALAGAAGLRREAKRIADTWSGPGLEPVTPVQPDESGQGEHLPPLQIGRGTRTARPALSAWSDRLHQAAAARSCAASGAGTAGNAAETKMA